jgi:preprotein translocase subunit SecG
VFRLSWFLVGLFIGCCLAIAAATQAREDASPIPSSPITVFLNIARGN